MQFQVPQFITVEDKIFGPLTLRQFIFLVGGAGLSFLIFRFIKPLFLAIILILPVAGFSLALAFYKMNGKPFIFTVEAAFKYMFSGKLYIWRKVPNKIEPREEDKSGPLVFVPKLSDSRLKDLAWSLDIKENVNPGTRETMGERGARNV